MRQTFSQHVSDQSQIGEGRRLAAQLAREAGFGDDALGSLGIVVTEAGTNLVKHAGGGQLLFRRLESPDGGVGIQMLSLDKGPGMANVHACLRDGFSTTSTPGNGLGAIRRMSRSFDVYSGIGRGTAVLAEVWSGAAQPSAPGMLVGAVNIAVQGEVECGDSWSVRHGAERTSVLLIDGLGHGLLAAQASALAVSAFDADPLKSAGSLVARIDDSLRPTRGAAGAVAVIDHTSGTVTYCGIGNITSSVITDDSERHMVSHNGTLGHSPKLRQEFTYPWTRTSALIMTSDGLGTRRALSSYPGLMSHHPSLVAAILYRDYVRGRDDATVLVVRDHGT